MLESKFSIVDFARRVLCRTVYFRLQSGERLALLLVVIISTFTWKIMELCARQNLSREFYPLDLVGSDPEVEAGFEIKRTSADK